MHQKTGDICEISMKEFVAVQSSFQSVKIQDLFIFIYFIFLPLLGANYQFFYSATLINSISDTIQCALFKQNKSYSRVTISHKYTKL